MCELDWVLHAAHGDSIGSLAVSSSSWARHFRHCSDFCDMVYADLHEAVD